LKWVIFLLNIKYSIYRYHFISIVLLVSLTHLRQFTYSHPLGRHCLDNFESSKACSPVPPQSAILNPVLRPFPLQPCTFPPCLVIVLRGTIQQLYRSILPLLTIPLHSTCLILVSLEVIPHSHPPHTRPFHNLPNHQGSLMERKSMSVPPATVVLQLVAT